LTEETLQTRRLQMSFWSSFSFMSRPRVTRETRRKCQDLSSCSEMIPEHDHHQPGLGPGWSSDGYGKTSFLDHLERGTDTYCRSDDSSRHLSLTTASLMRLVKDENDMNLNTIPSKTLASARTSTYQILSVNNHESSLSLTAVSNPCKFCSPTLSGQCLHTHYILPFYSSVAAQHFI
jgi:hypothetical protein